jgi:lauroyl/myristoyl acyltransferase
MKKSFLLIAAAAVLAAGASQAFARTSSAVKTVTIVMHDPGCHWFAVGKAYKTSLTVKGPISLRNLDEAALIVAGPHSVKLDAVGRQVALTKGVYKITMVGQAPDDNHLKLVVS